MRAWSRTNASARGRRDGFQRAGVGGGDRVVPAGVDAPQVPGGLVGDHALSHLTFEPAFCDDPAWSDLRWRSAQTRRQRDLQSLQELRHRLLQRLGQVGELDADLKAVQQ